MYNEDLELAKKAKKNSYAPYSNYHVGAVLRTKTGKTYTGCNIENKGIQSFCAERVAFAKAISEGERDFECITVVGEHENEETTPCGYCREFMSEFTDKDFIIYTVINDKIIENKISKLLPKTFNI